MALKKITPTHEAIDELDQAIKTLIRTKAALVASLPRQKKRKLKPEDRYIIHPLTGKKGFY